MNDTASSRPAPAPAPAPAGDAAARTKARTTAGDAGGGFAGALREAVRRPSRAALLKDLLLYGALAFPVAVDLLAPLEPWSASWWPRLAGLAVLAAAVAASRAWPTAALLTAITLTTVHGNFAFAMPVLSYLSGRRTVRARPLLWAFTAVLVGGSALSVARGEAVTTWFPLTVYLVLLGVLPWLVGRYWRQYRELLDAGWERAERLEHEQRIIAERERLRERARIAQDMHDSLGHELALIAVRAGALQVAPGLDDRHRDAAAQLRAGAAEATEQLRQIIGVLREDADPRTGPPEPARDDPEPDGPEPDGGTAPVRPPRESIGHLVERARASGVPVRLADPAAGTDTGGDTGGDAVVAGLPPMAALTAHRVVQEAVTNAAKHAPGAPVTVHLERGDGAVRVTVANDPPPTAPPPLPSGGHGLAGLTERVRLLGGALHAGPTPGGGFTVTADLPEHPPADVPAESPAPPAGTAAGTVERAARPTAATALRTALGLVPAPPGEWSSESARHRALARLRARRGLVTAIAVPTALMALLGSVMAGWYIYATVNSVLPPGDYAALRVGAPQADVAEALPPRETVGTGTVRQLVAEPPGADCRYYRPDANLLGISRVYRLCFSGGRLTSKHAYDISELSHERDRLKDDP